MTTSSENGQRSELLGMQTPPIVSAEEWKAAWEQLHVKEKAHSRARDALATERRRMPWLAVEKEYAFIGPEGKVSLFDLFDGRRQLILYRLNRHPTLDPLKVITIRIRHPVVMPDPPIVWRGLRIALG